MQKIAPESLIQSFGSMLDWSGESTLAKVTVPVAGFWSGRNGEPDALLEHKPEAMIGQVIASGHYVHLEATEQIQAMIKRCMQAWKL